MKSQFRFKTLAVALSAVASANAWALDPDYIRLGDSLMFTPTLKVTESYDDNIRASERDETSSWITTVTPTFQLGAEGSKGAYRLTYQAVADTFHSSQSDNNTDHHLTGEGVLQFNSRNKLAVNAGYHRVEETAALEADAVENDRYTNTETGAVYTFGSDEARTQIDFGAKYAELRYLSNDVNEDKERDTTTLNAILYYKLTGKTRALGEIRHTNQDYLQDTFNRSGDTLAYLVGLTWDATAKTTGTFKIGREKKEYDASGVKSLSGGMVETGITWQPRTYSTFSLNLRKGMDEGDQRSARSIDTQGYNLNWTHEWTELLKSDLYYAFSNRDYNGVAREDDLNSAGVNFTYSLRRWLDVGAGYRWSDNDSSLANQSYERNIYQMFVSASF